MAESFLAGHGSSFLGSAKLGRKFHRPAYWNNNGTAFVKLPNPIWPDVYRAVVFGQVHSLLCTQRRCPLPRRTKAAAQVVVPPTSTGGDATPAMMAPASTYDSPTPGQLAYAAAIASDVPSMLPRETATKGAALSPTPYSPATPIGFYQGFGGMFGAKAQGPPRTAEGGEGGSGGSLAPALVVDEGAKQKASDDGNPGAAKKPALAKT
ncbi:hypothetical protein B0H11DRAFT_1922193 [Mycena galericulata]|nr:hypothetical protein B0H11DRAFT_1922193 [Mycena galericulata]